MPTSSRLRSLDTLRGIAIMMVIAFHASLPFALPEHSRVVIGLGNFGVQLFFLISAYTMCHMWTQRQGETQRVLKFYIRRGLRIAPAFWFAIVFYMALHALTETTTTAVTQQITAWDIVLTALFLHGFSVQAINLVVPGGWSIAIEMSFYAIFPLLVARWHTAHARVLLAGMCYLLGMVLTVLLKPLLPVKSDLFLYYSLLTQLGIFPLGMAIYAGLQNSACVQWRKIVVILLGWMAISIISKAMNLPGRPFFWAGTFLLGAGVYWLIQRGWHNRFLSVCGQRSYSLYLFHFAVVDLVLSPSAAWLPQNILGWILGVVEVTAVSLLIAWVSGHTLEAYSSRWSKQWIGWLDRQPRQG